MAVIDIIRQRLEEAFSPSSLEVVDDSHLHRGHAGSRDGAGHYTVIIQSKSFDGLTRVDAHRKVYALFEDMIPAKIHALRIEIRKF